MGQKGPKDHPVPANCPVRWVFSVFSSAGYKDRSNHPSRHIVTSLADSKPSVEGTSSHKPTFLGLVPVSRGSRLASTPVPAPTEQDTAA